MIRTIINKMTLAGVVLALLAGSAAGQPMAGPAPIIPSFTEPSTASMLTTGPAMTAPVVPAVPVPPVSPSVSATPATTTTTTATQPAAAPPLFSLKIDPGQSQIGDSITVELESRDPSIKPDQIDSVVFEPDPEKWFVESHWRRELQKKDDGRPNPWRAVLRPFDTGELSIPAATVTYRAADGQRAQAESTTASLKVAPVRPPDAELALLGLRDPAAVPRDYTWLMLTAAAALLAAFALWLIFYWWKRRKLAPAPIMTEPELPPGLWALRELNRRSRLPAVQNGPAKPVFSHVSEVIRLYLDRRYGILAIDMTTHECLRALEGLRLSGEVLRWIREFLDECDMVKFTTIEPARERWLTIWHDARLIVKMTTPAEELGMDGAEEREFRREVAV